MDITEELYQLRDEKYAAFQSKLTPTLPEEDFIGVRVPVLRGYAKKLLREQPGKASAFLLILPHKFYDENMLHALLLSEEKNFDKAVSEVECFLPCVDNWAVCDIMSPKCFKKHKTELLPYIKKWCKSDKTYTVRFGIEMLMSHYLDDDFKPEYLDIPAAVISDEYYVNMMIAWYFATALAKQWDTALPYIENKILPPWVHNKTIQKAVESYRISPEQKTLLRTMKI